MLFLILILRACQENNTGKDRAPRKVIRDVKMLYEFRMPRERVNPGSADDPVSIDNCVQSTNE